MPARFLIEGETPRVGLDLTLGAERSNYLVKVMRMRRGAEVRCFDGAGTAFTARLVEPSPKRAVLSVIDVAPTVSAPELRLHLVLGLIKGAAMDRALQQAVELGAADIQIVTTARSNVRLDAKRSENKAVHWRRVLAGACEQSGRLHLPTLRLGGTLADALTEAPSDQAIALVPETEPLPRTLERQEWWLFIGRRVGGTRPNLITSST